MWKKVRFAALTWLESWSPLQRFEGWRDEALGRRVDERPDSFHWVGGIPQRRQDLILGRLTGHGLPWEGWRNWVAKWIEPQP
jgi:hypothetical protein